MSESTQVGVLALAAMFAGIGAVFSCRRVPWIVSTGWVMAIAGAYSSRELVARGETVLAVLAPVALVGVLALLSWSIRRDIRTSPAAAAERAAAAEPGPLDGRQADPDEVPDGPAWADHKTHDPRWDEESPQARIPKPKNMRRPE